MFRLFNNFYSPDDSNTIAPDSNVGGSGGKEDMIDFLADDSDEEVLPLTDKKEPKGKVKLDEETSDEDTEIEEESEEIDELDELEEELKGPTEEQLELVTPVRRKEILAKYPKLFKEFPYLEKAYYRDQQFTELLPTINDAKEAVEAQQTLNRFSKDIGQGNTEPLLKTIKTENPEAFNKVIDDYLPALARVDEQAYYHVIGNLTKHTIVAMVQEAKKSGNDVLQNAAQILNQFVFGSSDFKAPTYLSKKPAANGEDTEIKQQRQQFVKQQFETVNTDLNTRVNNTLKNTIDANIDPNKSMTDYVRKNATREALENLESLISKDTRFKALADRLWEAALKDNFSKASVDKIKSAYLSKSKTLLPSVIKKARNEALRGLGKKVSSDEDTNDSDKKGPISPGRPRSQQSSGKIKTSKDIPKGMTSKDFLMQD